jgi:hypothetical protein
MSASVTSRRAVLATALGAAGAATAAALAGPAAALAANGDPVKVGEENTATTYTQIENTTVGTQEAGVIGKASGVGVLGVSVPGQGVIGRSTDGAGVQGYSVNDAGLHGFGGPYGLWADGTSVGVHGRGLGDGRGIHGEATTGVGGYFTATPGAALQVVGKAQFSRSGKAAVPKGRSYVDIIVPGGFTNHSMVHATLQNYRPGVSVAAVVTGSRADGKARIYLTKVASTTATTFVAWFVAEY